MIANLLSALVLLLLLFALLVWLKKPIYRLERHNLQRLFRLVLEDQASDNDWNVFIEFPIRYQPAFEQLRLRCCKLTEQYGRYREGQFILSEPGKALLQRELDELEADV